MLTSNVQAVTTHTRKITTSSRDLSTTLSDFLKASSHHVSTIRTSAEAYRTKELETLAGVSAKINQQVEKVQEILKVIRGKEEVADEAVRGLEGALSASLEGIRGAFEGWAGEVRRQCEGTCKEAEVAAAVSYSTVRHFCRVGTRSVLCC